MLDLARLFAHDAWANREALASVRAAATPPRSLKFLAHIIAVEWLWYERLLESGERVVVWPDWDLAECVRQMGPLPSTWDEYLSDVQLEREVTYVNSKGEQYTNRVEDILMQVLQHSAYHRGQIAADVRAAGGTPAYTDYIEYVRMPRA